MHIEDFGLIALGYFSLLFMGFSINKIVRLLPFSERTWKLLTGFFLLILYLTCYIFGVHLYNYLELNAIFRLYISYALGVVSWLSAAYLLSQIIHYFVWNGILKKKDESGVPFLLRNGVDIVIYSIASILITHFVFGKAANGLIATSSVITIILGISARTTLASLFAGLSLNLSKGIKKGDFIVLSKSNIRGKIIDMDWRSVTIVTQNDNIQVIPNDHLANSVVLNLTYPTPRRMVEVKVMQKYKYSPQKMKDLLVEAALNSPHVLNKPRPQALVSSFEEEGIIYTIRVHTLYFDDELVINDVLSAVWYTFRRGGLQFSAVDSDDDDELEEVEKVVENKQKINVIEKKSIESEKSEVHKIILKLREKDLLKIFTTDEVEYLLLNSNKLIFGPPEQVIEQGDEGDSLFVVIEGRLRVYILHSDSEEQDVGELKAGDIFGEKAILFGEKRGATVSAITEVKVYEIKRKFLDMVIEKRVQILDELSLLFAQREISNQEKTNHYITIKQREELLELEQKKIKNLLLGVFKRQK